MPGDTAWKPATPQLSLVLPGDPASHFHSADVEIESRKARRSDSLIHEALYLDQEDAYGAGVVDANICSCISTSRYDSRLASSRLRISSRVEHRSRRLARERERRESRRRTS